jgi:hypothetical protein
MSSCIRTSQRISTAPKKYEPDQDNSRKRKALEKYEQQLKNIEDKKKADEMLLRDIESKNLLIESKNLLIESYVAEIQSLTARVEELETIVSREKRHKKEKKDKKDKKDNNIIINYNLYN